MNWPIIGSTLFIFSWSLSWPSAWVFLTELVAYTYLDALFLAKWSPHLLSTRLKAKFSSDQPKADKWITTLLVAVTTLLWVVIALDHRYAWSTTQVWLQIIGQLIIITALLLRSWSLVSNEFAIATIQVQQEQTVIKTGPYRYIRHPIYASSISFCTGSSLMLGSYWGLIPTLCIAAMFIMRIRVEEKLLSYNLHGYRQYKEEVPNRLIPKLW